jgi:hypothetical protein
LVAMVLIILFYLGMVGFAIANGAAGDAPSP